MEGVFIENVMNKAKREHLDAITESGFEQWKEHDAFIMFASSTNGSGLVEIGIDGRGKPTVRIGGAMVPFPNFEQAKEFYAKSLNHDNSELFETL